MTANRMFSEPALKAFRHFLAVDAKTRSTSKSPPGAFDQVTPQLKQKLARDRSIGPQKTVATETFDDDDDDGAEPIESGKRGDIDQLIQLVSELCGGDKEGMDRFFKQLEASFPGSVGEVGEMSDNVGEDEPMPFKGMPKPGGTLYGQDSYTRMYGHSHIGLDPISPAPPSREQLIAMDASPDESYEAMFGKNHIKILY